MQRANKEYLLGVMKILVEGQEPEESEAFHSLVDEAVSQLEEQLAETAGYLRLQIFEFSGPHLMPVEGTYSPLDFLQIGLTEKLERRFNFLLLVTEVDLSSSIHSYVLALPSQLTNIGIITTKRLHPRFWGAEGEEAVTVHRLTVLMLHTLGHLLNLPHHTDPANVMRDVEVVQQLDDMRTITPEQIRLIQTNLPFEARDEVGRENRWAFTFRQIAANWGTIWRTVVRANPLKLSLRLPTMITAGLSVVIVLFFTAEIWDVTSALRPGALVIFSLIALAASTLVLYRSFGIGTGSARQKAILESKVVTTAATIATLTITIFLHYATFFLVGFVGAATFFPDPLKETWPTTDAATRVVDYVKLGMFLGAMGVLTGSLGGSADSRAVIQRVLFVDEET